MERPKRRKKKDNPYTLEYISEDDDYNVLFKDSKGVLRSVVVSEDVFNAMDKFELDDLSELNEYDNHIEHNEVYEWNINMRSLNKQEEVEEYIIRKSTYEDLMAAINKLPIIQQRRIKMYYFYDMSSKEISIIENCSQHSVRVSIRKSLKKLKKILKS